MRLERPATSYSQETAHFLLACFNDVLSEQSADYSSAISQEPGSSAEFRKYYVDKLKGVCLLIKYFSPIHIYLFLSFRYQINTMKN